MTDPSSKKNMRKGTHSEYRTELFMPIMREADGKYIAVLSDDSIDRDDEKCSKGCIEKLGLDDEYLVALCNHQNNVFMQVAEWTNRGCREVDGHTALIAEPRFYDKSNPNAKIIKDMLDEGAKFGVSIGAIVKDYDEIDGMRIFKELELVEASFVAVPSNRHGRAMAIAKSYNKKNTEASKMDEAEINKKIQEAVDKKAEEVKADFEKQLTDKDAEITKLQGDLKKNEEDSEAAKEEAENAAEDAEKKLKEKQKEIEDANKKAEDAGKAALEKQKYADEHGYGKKVLTEEEMNKEFKAGKLPVMRT
jgi:flagellar biosynthesis GTPase FlhF